MAVGTTDTAAPAAAPAASPDITAPEQTVTTVAPAPESDFPGRGPLPATVASGDADLLKIQQHFAVVNRWGETVYISQDESAAEQELLRISGVGDATGGAPTASLISVRAVVVGETRPDGAA